MFYVGAGEDFESGVTSRELTVRASDGTHTIDTTVIVTVTDAAEVPAFGEESYAFALSEHTDGSVERVSLGTVSATDPDGDAVRYSLAGGNASGLFAIDAVSGEVFYVGAGEDYESGVTSRELTVQASDGTHTVDTTVTVTVTDVQGSSEPSDEDLPADTTTSGVVLVDEGAVTGTLRSQSDRDWFAVTLAPGRTYRFAFESETDGRPDAQIRGLRDANGTPIPGTGSGSEVRFTTDKDATDTTYYVEVGGGTGQSAQRGLSIDDARSTSNEGTRYANKSDWSGSSYSLRVTVEDAHTAGTDTAGTVEVGGSVTGEIDHGGDLDWFAVTLEAGRTYRFGLEGSATDAGTLYDPYLRGLHDSNGNLIAGTEDNNGGEGRNALVTFTAPEGGTYYVSAGAWSDQEGTYTLRATDLTAPPTEPQSEGNELPVIRISDEEAHERDGVLRFRVTLDKASTETVTVHYATADVTATAGGDYEPAVGILEFAPGETEKWVEVVLIDDPVEDSGETFVLRLTDAVGARTEASEGVGTIRNSEHDTIVSEGDMDFPADTTTTGRVAVGGSATGEIGADGDLDWFGVTLEANRTYQFDLEGSRTGAGTLSDPFLRGIHDTSGNLIDGTTNDDKGIGRNSRVTLAPTQAGTYYVSAGAWSDREGTYTLRVADVTSGIADDLPADTTTTRTVAVGGTATGAIEYNGDHDWFAVTLAAGRNYRFDLEGTETNGGTMYNPYLRGIHDSSGTLIPGTTDDDDGACRNSRLTFTPTQAGTYYVSAGGWSDQEGTYTLRVTDDTNGIADDYTAGVDTTGRVAVGGTATGEIEYNDSEDWFAVTLATGKTYRFDLEGRVTSGGTLSDPYLRGIYDADGNLIAGTTNDENGVGRNSRVDFTATAARAPTTCRPGPGTTGKEPTH